MFCVVSEGPEASAAADFERLAVNRNHAATRGRRSGHNIPFLMMADVWSSTLIEREVPHGDRAAPVSDHVVGPFCPTSPGGHRVREGSTRRTRLALRSPFGKVRTFERKRVVDLRHCRGLTRIPMPSNAIDKLVSPWIAKFRDGASPQRKVVVQHPDLRGDVCLPEERPEIFVHKQNLVFLGPLAGGVAAINSGIDLVLY